MTEKNGLDERLLALCGGLDALSSAISGASSEARPLNEAYGWNVPAVSRGDVIALITSLADRVRAEPDVVLTEQQAENIQIFTRGIVFLTANTVPQLFSGNVVTALPALLMTLTTLDSLLSEVFHWPASPDLHSLPPRLAKRIKAAATRVAAVENSTGDLDAKVSKILEAYEAADSLDVDLDALSEAREKTSRFEADARIATQKIEEMRSEAYRRSETLQRLEQDAQAIVEKCEDAYRIATSKGLAGAFDDRAHKLNVSIRWWTGSLIFALVIGAVIGYDRVHALSGLLTSSAPSWGAITLHIGVSLVSVGAPFWFAWLATKQIGQRFRLAEDYAFKASVSKAYEGYRKEAVRIDPSFESRLFGSTLSRLEEAPLRLLADDKNHGSPWHELVNSKAFLKAMSMVPELREKVVDLAGKTASNKGAPDASSNTTGDSSPARE
ncbi:hypothetical protein R69608_05083 [Paraburkholderia nemoris]|uniref:hypothetical protein n=1 Tax=Paraburkholderia nemoris TaxID=2793076 RepID=UPI001912C71D|nr:hypothetical protein [Paraburkholderia nemoris]MBK5149710.1 hypothetical protein [Burkholderia sp. R-69608]CAE6938294.1 hypothetical protein R69608_05083 [Paraburkholderia nemoris]